MACRRVAAVARRTDIFDISRYAVPSALDGRVRRRLLDGCGSGAVGLTGMGLGDGCSLAFSKTLAAQQKMVASLASCLFGALYAPVWSSNERRAVYESPGTLWDRWLPRGARLWRVAEA